MAGADKMNVQPESLRALGTAWHLDAQAIRSLDPGGAVGSGSTGLPGSATAMAMLSAGQELNVGIERAAGRFTSMAEAARSAADITDAEEADFVDRLRRIDGTR